MKNPVDVELGKLVRETRKTISMTQTQLAEASGVKFQQIQKYEVGANRISASRLVAIARAMGTSPGLLIDKAAHRAKSKW
ncbi:MAG TPA: helix-turn-helix transcriptional regulator [Novosphingobium sp.]|jgi:transcriptional regulator with XRE-family HTH domain|nr:helix-turn-helix transcriptional regulator [Novosphingobium sp.]